MIQPAVLIIGHLNQKLNARTFRSIVGAIQDYQDGYLVSKFRKMLVETVSQFLFV